jgi:hypothetical protein
VALTGHDQPAAQTLTRQQERAMLAFLWSAGAEGFDIEAYDGSVWDQGVRPWPTMDNLVKLGLVERIQWWDEEAGWQYELTDAGKAYMRTVVEARRAA